MGFNWPFFHKTEPIVDPVPAVCNALVKAYAEKCVEVAVLLLELDAARRHPRDTDGRFVNPIKAKAEQLRGEMQAKANAPLEEALEAQRIASRFAPEKGRVVA